MVITLCMRYWTGHVEEIEFELALAVNGNLIKHSANIADFKTELCNSLLSCALVLLDITISFEGQLPQVLKPKVHKRLQMQYMGRCNKNGKI